MHEYRISKYDPRFRDALGAYLRDDWIMFRQVGESVGGKVLTLEEYERVELLYINAALAFMREAGVLSLAVKAGEKLPPSLRDGQMLSREEIVGVLRDMLREKCWCRLEGHDSFIHTGWDFYMYIGVSRLCPDAKNLAHASGLFVEEFTSPHHP